MYAAELDCFVHIQPSATHDQHAVKGGPARLPEWLHHHGRTWHEVNGWVH